MNFNQTFFTIINCGKWFRLTIIILINFMFSPCIFKVNHFYLPTNALNCIKLRRLKSTCINILKDKNSDMFRILWDPSSECIKRASLKLLVMFCVRSRCLAAWKFGPVVCVSGATSWELEFYTIKCISRQIKVIDYNYICIFVLVTLKMATWVAETCRWLLCSKIIFIKPSAFISSVKNFKHYCTDLGT